MTYKCCFRHIGLLVAAFCLTTLVDAGISHARFHPSWTWKTIRNGNFTIYYPEGYEAFAARVAGLSKEVGDDVSGYFGVTPPGCPVVLNPGTDIFNGSYEPFPNRITLHETPGAELFGFGPSPDILDILYTHEYTHFVHITSSSGLYRTMTKFLGNGLSVANGVSPMWIIEGVTTNTETMFTASGRGRSAYFRGIMMSFTEPGLHWDLTSLGASSPYAPPSGRFYLTGYHMVEYLNRRWGESAFAELNAYQAKHPLGGSTRAIRHVTGMTPDSFYRAFHEDYQKRSNDHRTTIDADPLPQGRIIAEGALDSYISFFWTEDATLIALRQSYEEQSAIVKIDPVTSQVLEVHKTGRMPTFSAIRPTRSGEIVYAAPLPHPLGGYDLATADLMLFDPETSSHKRLTRGIHAYYADEAPDGDGYIAVCRNGMWTELSFLSESGEKQRSLAGNPGMIFEKPVWSPDGDHLAVALYNGADTDIVLVDPKAGGMDYLFAPDTYLDIDPSFSPDGEWLVFSSDRSGVFNIYAWHITEQILYQLTSVYYHAAQPQISPDGSKIAFTRVRHGVSVLCEMPFEPRKGRVVPAAPTNGRKPRPVLPAPLTKEDVEPGGIPLTEAYRPYIHTPWFESDDEGATGGLMLIGGDPVGIASYQAKFLYGFNSNRPGFDVSLTNTSFWPRFSLRAYDSSWEGNTLDGGKSRWIRERGGEVRTGLSLYLRSIPDVVTSDISFGIRTRLFEDIDGESLRGKERSVSTFGRLDVIRSTATARRDIGRGWGQALSIQYEKATSAFDADLPGHNVFLTLSQWIPSPVRHHTFRFGLVHQSQEGRLIYDKDRALPRGYTDSSASGGLRFRKTLTFRSEYSFPIAYPDFGIGLMLWHVKRIKGTVFCDHGGGWSGDFSSSFFGTHARTTAGVSVTNHASVFNLPVEFGLRGSYRVHENEMFLQFIYAAQL